MIHHASGRFWDYYHFLPREIRELADKNYQLLKSNPRHSALHFKKIGKYWSVRIGLAYRCLGIDIEDGILWFWIGLHEEYDRLVASQ